jgi:type II secretory pathway component GspD/PulD (secretin)
VGNAVVGFCVDAAQQTIFGEIGVNGLASVLLFLRRAIAAGPLALSAVVLFSWLCLARADDPKESTAAAPATTSASGDGEKAKKRSDKPTSDKPEGDKKGDGDKKSDAEKKPDDQPGDDKSKEKKPDDTTPIHRPADPPKPADPNELKAKPDADNLVTFSFKGQPWQAVLEWLADISHMSLDWQEVPAGYLDLSTRRKYSIDEARDLINSILLSKAFTLLRNGEVLIVVNLKNLDVSLVPRVSPKELDQCGTFEFVRTFFNLDRLQAEPLVEEIKPLLGQYGKINALKTTNRIDILDTAGNLRRIREIIGAEQNESGKEHQLKQFPLHYARPDDVLATLKHLLGIQDKGDGGGGGGGNMQDVRQQLQQQQQMLQQMQQQQGEKGKQRQQQQEEKIYLAINRRENSIMALATPDKLATIEQAVKLLDVPSPSDSADSVLQRISSYRLATAEPGPIVNILKEMGNLDPSTQLEVDNVNHAIIVNGPLADHWTVQSLIKKIDGSARHIEVFKLQKLDAENVAGSIEFLMRGPSKDNNRPRYVFGDYHSPDQGKDGGFQVEADTKNNRLLLKANDLELQEVRKLMIKLGEDPFADTEGDNLRVIHPAPGKDTDVLLDRLKRIWPSVSPHPLQLEVEQQTEPPKKAPAKDDDGNEKKSGDKNAKPEEAERGKLQPAKPLNVTPPTATAVIPWHHKQFTATSDLAGETSPSTTPQETLPLKKADEPTRFSPPRNREAPTALDNTPVRRPSEEVDSAAPAPISIIQGPQGLIVTSRDAASVDQLMKLIDQLSPASSRYQAFTLKHVYAKDVAYLLEGIFADDKKQRDSLSINYFFDPQPEEKPERNRLSKKQPLKFTADSVTNSILVQNADEDQLAEIKSLIEFYDKPEPADSQSIRKTKIVGLKYAKAQAVADVLKDVYVDLLSPNDKSLRSNNPKQQDQQRPFYSLYDMGSRNQSSTENVPKFKSLLSIGVESTSNSLVVSAPQYLLEDVLAMIDRLDVATRTMEPVVRVMSAGGAFTDSLILDALKNVTDPDGKHSSSSSQSRDQQRNRNGGNNNNNNGRNGNGNGRNNGGNNNNSGNNNQNNNR